MSDVVGEPVGAADLRDKVALVTGGASGIGRATCLALAEVGAVVVVADVEEDGGRAVASEVGGHFVRTDVSDLEAVRATVNFAVAEAGGLDLAHLNAGVITGCTVGDDFSLEAYRRAMGVNLDGVVFGAHACRAAMLARGGGAIVATASLAGLTTMPMDPVYTANKHAVVGLTRALGPAFAAEGIRFNAVCPGFAESAIIETLRDFLDETGLPIIPAETVAATVLRLFTLDVSGECWFVQPHREPAPFHFRGVPGPGQPPA